MIFDDKLSVILVSIRMPGVELEPTNPGCIINAFTGGILNDLINVELTAERLLTERQPSGERPFLGWFLFQVEDVHRAAAIVHGVLQRNGIARWATVFRWDEDELVWRSLYPMGTDLLNQDVVAEMTALAAKCSAVVAAWTQRLSRPNPSESDANQQ